MPVPDWRVELQLLPEAIEDGLQRLGAHFEKDSRSKDYPVRDFIGAGYQTDPTKLPSKRWKRNIPILDQGGLGSCTGNAGTGMVACSPLFDKDASRFKGLVEDEHFAVNLYERATRMDAIGPPYYPPSDRGSTTLGVLKALVSMGMIDEYRWGFSLTDALNSIALLGAGITGIGWYTGFDSPDPDGRLQINGTIRGGHELVLDEIDVPNQRVWGDNSWSAGWGNQQGRFYLTWADFGTLLTDQGEFGVGVWH